jgi:hypothetical protein
MSNPSLDRALQDTLKAHEHPQVLIRRIPALEDPIFVGLG